MSTVIPLPRRRGRPKSAHSGNDTGTPELILKRLLGQTAEALDLCLERGIITREQHWCGIHLRWLYTLRHGAPGVRTIDPTHLGGIELKTDDPDWRNEREREYHDAIRKLTPSGAAPQILGICIYNERPKFLNPGKKSYAQQELLSISITALRDGLDILVKHWGRTVKK